MPEIPSEWQTALIAPDPRRNDCTRMAGRRGWGKNRRTGQRPDVRQGGGPRRVHGPAADWIDANQLGRRNLSPDVMSLLRGRMYRRTKKPHGGQLPREGMGQNEPSLPTADRLAEEHGVSAPTIKRDGLFAASVEALKPTVPDIEDRVMAGEVTRPTSRRPERQPLTESSSENVWVLRVADLGDNYAPASAHAKESS